MILNNFKLLRMYAENIKAQSADPTTFVKAVDGSAVKYAATSNDTFMNANRVLQSDLYVLLGTGTTQPSNTDFNLEHSVSLSNMQYTRSYQITNDEDTPKVVITVNVTGFNGTNNDINIYEYGFYRQIKPDHYSSGTNKNVLLTRDILETPIVLEAGKGFALTVTWIEE